MTQASANLNIMIKAARRASRGLLRDFNEVENLQVSSKSAGDFVSKADLKAEEIISEELCDARPNYGWIGEESEEREGRDPTRRWIVDPLDGTSNFLHGIPHWAISIALEYKNEIVAGVIYDPIKDEMFTAEKGQGAWLNDRRLRVSDRTNTIEMLFATGVPFGTKNGLKSTLKELEKLMPKCAGIRRQGAAALDLAYVAAGRLDGYWEKGIQAWDMAAGLVIAKEAGALIEGFASPLEDPLTSGSVICANNLIFKNFAEILRE
ncbi:MAG: inositol monophosphatase [Rhodobacteraceae bacterium]|nr:MAG: inositol monophosphatase [Paracoccaceae bacterium]